MITIERASNGYITSDTNGEQTIHTDKVTLMKYLADTLDGPEVKIVRVKPAPVAPPEP